MNQVELEQYAVSGGVEQMQAALSGNVADGKAHLNFYSNAVYKRFVIPLSEVIDVMTEEVKRGPQAVAKLYLKQCNSRTAAFLAVRTCLDKALSEQTYTSTACMIGGLVYGEVLLSRFADLAPELYFTLTRDLKRKLSSDEKHRILVFKAEAERKGLEVPVWGAEDKAQVGLALLSLCEAMGLIEGELEAGKGVKKGRKMVRLTESVQQLLGGLEGYAAQMAPWTLPCVEQPQDWTTPNDGGYHTLEMKRLCPSIIRGRSRVEDYDVPQHRLDALNKLQRQRWCINQRVLDTLIECRAVMDVGKEVRTIREQPMPTKPRWLDGQIKEKDMSRDQLAEFKQWKRATAEWHTTKKIRARCNNRVNEAIKVARLMGNSAFHFVWQYDYRGRSYATTRGISPQGSDMQKALMMAAEGLPMGDDPETAYWFKIAGANRFDHDKLTLDERAAWVDDNHEELMAMADDPLTHTAWMDVDKPFTAIAWVFEYAHWQRDPAGFYTHLPLGQDGSCNGLQHYSAMLRDEIGGAAVNLTPSNSRKDIYGIVAVETLPIVRASDEDRVGSRRKWLQHGMNRSLVKRSVMTLPYAATRFSMADFIYEDYIAKGKAPEFEGQEGRVSATWLSYRVWDAIGKVVVKAREAMEWLQAGSEEILAAHPAGVVWKAPDGFTVRQQYSKQKFVRVACKITEGPRIFVKLAVPDGEDAPEDPRRHKQGVAPNFIHSMDGAHLTRVVNAFPGFLAVVHDDFGCLAPLVPQLHRVLRDTLVEQYETSDPLGDLASRYSLAPPPVAGNLDLGDIRKSLYCFD